MKAAESQCVTAYDDRLGELGIDRQNPSSVPELGHPIVKCSTIERGPYAVTSPSCETLMPIPTLDMLRVAAVRPLPGLPQAIFRSRVFIPSATIFPSPD